MVRTQIYLPDDIHRDLKLLAATTGKRFSDLVREGARHILNKKRKVKKNNFEAWKSLVGVAKGGKKTNGVRAVNDYYENDVV